VEGGESPAAEALQVSANPLFRVRQRQNSFQDDEAISRIITIDQFTRELLVKRGSVLDERGRVQYSSPEDVLRIVIQKAVASKSEFLMVISTHRLWFQDGSAGLLRWLEAFWGDHIEFPQIRNERSDASQMQRLSSAINILKFLKMWYSSMPADWGVLYRKQKHSKLLGRLDKEAATPSAMPNLADDFAVALQKHELRRRLMCFLKRITDECVAALQTEAQEDLHALDVEHIALLNLARKLLRILRKDHVKVANDLADEAEAAAGVPRSNSCPEEEPFLKKKYAEQLALGKNDSLTSIPPEVDSLPLWDYLRHTAEISPRRIPTATPPRANPRAKPLTPRRRLFLSPRMTATMRRTSQDLMGERPEVRRVAAGEGTKTRRRTLSSATIRTLVVDPVSMTSSPDSLSRGGSTPGSGLRSPPSSSGLWTPTDEMGTGQTNSDERTNISGSRSTSDHFNANSVSDDSGAITSDHSGDMTHSDSIGSINELSDMSTSPRKPTVTRRKSRAVSFSLSERERRQAMGGGRKTSIPNNSRLLRSKAGKKMSDPNWGDSKGKPPDLLRVRSIDSTVRRGRSGLGDISPDQRSSVVEGGSFSPTIGSPLACQRSNSPRDKEEDAEPMMFVVDEPMDRVQMPVPPAVHNLSVKLFFDDMSSKWLAQQMTVYDCSIFRGITVEEFLGFGWTRPDRQAHAPNISKATTWFNSMSFALTCILVNKSTPSARAIVMARYVYAMNECRKLRNFHSVMIFLSCLNSASVARLKLSWQAVPSQCVELLRKHTEMMSHLGGFKEYRKAIATKVRSKNTYVPHMGVMLSDLVHLNDKSPTFRTDGNGRKQVSVSKMMELSALLRKWPWSAFSRICNSILGDEDLLDVFDAVTRSDTESMEDMLWERSISAEKTAAQV